MNLSWWVKNTSLMQLNQMMLQKNFREKSVIPQFQGVLRCRPHNTDTFKNWSNREQRL